MKLSKKPQRSGQVKLPPAPTAVYSVEERLTLGAREVKATKVATGHTLDDEAQPSL
jgi:hypothetical protein